MNQTLTRPQRIARFALPILLVLGLVGIIAAIFLPTPWNKKADPGANAYEIPDFSLTDRSGKTITKDDLKGNVWVASFVFTRCTGPCPSVTKTMAKLQADIDLANKSDIRLVTFTVDPGRDGPKELQKYAENFRAHPDRWLFLTGPEDDLHKLMKTGFKLGIARSELTTPPEGQEFDHSTLIVLVDKKGRARGHFDGYEGPNDAGGEKYKESQTVLRAMIETLRAE